MTQKLMLLGCVLLMAIPGQAQSAGKHCSTWGDGTHTVVCPNIITANGITIGGNTSTMTITVTGSGGGVSYSGGGAPSIPVMTSPTAMADSGMAAILNSGGNGLIVVGGGSQIPGWAASTGYCPINDACFVGFNRGLVSDGTNLETQTGSSNCTSGSSTPSWNGRAGGTTTESSGTGPCIWTNVGPLPALLVYDAAGNLDMQVGGLATIDGVTLNNPLSANELHDSNGLVVFSANGNDPMSNTDLVGTVSNGWGDFFGLNNWGCVSSGACSFAGGIVTINDFGAVGINQNLTVGLCTSSASGICAAGNIAAGANHSVTVPIIADGSGNCATFAMTCTGIGNPCTAGYVQIACP